MFTKKMQAAILLAFTLTSGSAMAVEDLNQRLEESLPVPKAVQNHSEQKMHMGISAGLNSPNGGYDNTVGLGAEVGFQPYIPFGLGAEIFNTSMDKNNQNHDDRRTTVLAKGTYNFGGDIPVLRQSYVGVAAGPVLTGNTLDLGLAPLLGFDIPVTKIGTRDVTLGANAKYLFTSSDTPNSFMTNLAIKYWY